MVIGLSEIMCLIAICMVCASMKAYILNYIIVHI